MLKTKFPSLFYKNIRKGSHGSGTWSIPGGYLEFGEDIISCGLRELEEEVGITANEIASVRIIPHISNNILKENEDDSCEVTTHTLSVFVEARIKNQDHPPEPKIMEPEKCYEWKWVKYDEETCPKPFFKPLENLFKSDYSP